MTIQFAILGLLSIKPFSGYDLKKVIASSAAFYWSGNNNQIYRALVELHQADLVTQEVQLQESRPARKIYTITEKGQAALAAWLRQPPEVPEFRSPFLVQLSWADLLSPGELDELLATYEAEVRVQIRMLEEQARRATAAPGRTRREAYLWEMIDQHAVSAYQNELRWIAQVRAGLDRIEAEAPAQPSEESK